MPLTGDWPSKEASTRPAQVRWAEVVHKAISANSDALAEQIMALHFERNPDLAAAYGPRQKAFYLEDTKHNLDSLSAAMLFETPEIFEDYVTWLVDLLQTRNIPTGGLPLHFDCVRDVLHKALPEEVHSRLDAYIEAGVRALSARQS